MAAVIDFLAIELADHVAVLNSRGCCGTFLFDIANQRAALVGKFKLLCQFGGDRLNHDAEITAHDAAFLDDSVHDDASHIDGHSEADPHIPAGAANDGGVHADEPAFDIDQCASGITRVDGGVGLNEIFVIDDAESAAANGANDAHRNGLSHAKRIADGEDNVAHLQVGAVGDGHGSEVLRVDFED